MPTAGMQQKGHRFGAGPIPVREMQHVFPEFQISFDGFGEYPYLEHVNLVASFEKIGGMMNILIFCVIDEHWRLDIEPLDYMLCQRS